eukprot:CAMPEP_0194527954 /NCGR_PEP_ID=MMETSP0253-20130528/64234_1 /TAXON_ID=2966 /ORGANISM="Noctiluca scintillans" /LENGTH=131 /DNA_ID=CAMNT_0039372959 /DNA_START=127 /DNA_END=522 /DNA_ORIENTATION=+
MFNCQQHAGELDDDAQHHQRLAELDVLIPFSAMQVALGHPEEESHRSEGHTTVNDAMERIEVVPTHCRPEKNLDNQGQADERLERAHQPGRVPQRRTQTQGRHQDACSHQEGKHVKKRRCPRKIHPCNQLA